MIGADTARHVAPPSAPPLAGEAPGDPACDICGQEFGDSQTRCEDCISCADCGVLTAWHESRRCERCRPKCRYCGDTGTVAGDYPWADVDCRCVKESRCDEEYD